MLIDDGTQNFYNIHFSIDKFRLYSFRNTDAGGRFHSFASTSIAERMGLA